MCIITCNTPNLMHLGECNPTPLSTAMNTYVNVVHLCFDDVTDVPSAFSEWDRKEMYCKIMIALYFRMKAAYLT